MYGNAPDLAGAGLGEPQVAIRPAGDVGKSSDAAGRGNGKLGDDPYCRAHRNYSFLHSHLVTRCIDEPAHSIPQEKSCDTCEITCSDYLFFLKTSGVERSAKLAGLGGLFFN